MCNAYPIYSPHFLLTSQIPEKPQVIASKDELMDLLLLQKYFGSIKCGFQINFNSNNAGLTIGGASVSVWHCQIADLGLGDQTKLSHSSIYTLPESYGGVAVCQYDHIKTTHRVFMSYNISFLADAVFKYISILHDANNAYNLTLNVDETGWFSVLLTIRGNWYDKNSSLEFPHSDTPAFAEMAGSWVFTDESEFLSIKKVLDEQGPDKVVEIIEGWQWAASQDLETVIKFDKAFFGN